MYVTPTTTVTEIRAQIARLKAELHESTTLSDLDRVAVMDEISYLESFLPTDA